MLTSLINIITKHKRILISTCWLNFVQYYSALVKRTVHDTYYLPTVRNELKHNRNNQLKMPTE